MRRRISLGLVAGLAGTTLVLFGPAPPAWAWVVCGGTGTFTTEPALLFPVLLGIGVPPGSPAPGKDHAVDVFIGGPTNVIHGFGMTFAPGGCVHGVSFGVPVSNGVLAGYCGHMSGIGTLGGQPFSFVGLGTTLVLTGQVTGILNTVPIPLVTGSCLHAATPAGPLHGLPGGATDFLVSGAAIGFNCPNFTPSPTTTVELVESDTSVAGQLVGVHALVRLFFWFSQPCLGSPVL